MPDINITTQLPGESIITKALEFILRIRDGMSEENRNKWDAIGLNLLKHWNNWWVSKGWPGEPID